MPGGDLVGDGARVHPGLTVVVGFDDVGVQDVACARVGSELGLEEARVVGLDGEEEDRSARAVDNKGGIGVSDLVRTGGTGDCGPHGGPGLAAILRDAVDDRVCLGGVLAVVGAPIPCGQDPAVGGGGQRGNSVAGETGEAGGSEADLVANRVVLRGLQRVRGRGTLTLGDGHRVDVGGDVARDNVRSLAVPRRGPGGGGGEVSGRNIVGGHGVCGGRALLGGVRGQVVPAAVGGTGGQHTGQIRGDREDGERTVRVVRVRESDGDDVTGVDRLTIGVGSRGGDGDRGRVCIGR